MGIGVEVSCRCFGSFTLQVGPGIASPTICFFPFLCSECQGVSNLDVHAAELSCSHCGSSAVVPYGSPPAVGEVGPVVVFCYGPSERFKREQLTLTDGTYFCPSCRGYAARFRDTGIRWD